MSLNMCIRASFLLGSYLGSTPLTWDVKATEKRRMTALTVESVNCVQKLIQPYRIIALVARPSARLAASPIAFSFDGISAGADGKAYSPAAPCNRRDDRLDEAADEVEGALEATC